MTISKPIASTIFAAILVLWSLPASAQTAPKRDWADRYLARIDPDRKGYATLADAERFAAEQFDRLDANRDGVVDHDEFMAPIRRALDRASPAGKDRLQRSLERRETLFRALDQRGDGKITRDQYLAATRQHFAEIDAAKDGKVTADELRAAHRGL